MSEEKGRMTATLERCFKDPTLFGDMGTFTFANAPDLFMDAVDLTFMHKRPREVEPGAWLACAFCVLTQFHPGTAHKPNTHRYYGRLDDATKTDMGGKMTGISWSVQNYGGDWITDYYKRLAEVCEITGPNALTDPELVRTTFRLDGLEAAYALVTERHIPATDNPDVGSW